MDARKRHYLAAMDIPLYVRRDAPPLEADVEARGSGPTAANAEAAEAEPVRDKSVAPTIATSTGSDSAFDSWEPLEAAVRGCRLCTLCETRTNTVFGVGDRSAAWMIIGEAPGADEDAQGEPFVGRGGRLLTAMLEAAGAPRERVFIANVLKCRPPGNRDPKPEEADACADYLNAQVALVKPKLIIAVGRIAAQRLLATDTPIGKLRGTVHQYGDTGIPLVATYHPAYLLRSPGQKRRAWDDMKLALSVVSPDVRTP